MTQFLPALALALIATAASAQTAEPFDSSQVRRLSPEEKERILADNERRAKEAEFDAALGNANPRPSGIHGEIGGVIGTGGTRGIFGTALVPLGDSGSAIFSFEDFRTGTLDRPNARRRAAPK
ncbi:hypothetical protein GON01_00820 [Sphingomonas sp. MAH-20]|uniref:Uncharacterized protein n=1 Tax=Sphingomonas horti TaxID=2682842 RepID=A0A6I4IWT2_9SPHN|nr:hypothetical protein [Sphingomonas sp. CGMCC 1.13658]MBA2920228.1 hypothetical protein [Sphingomonas sp. CGMCC 1.13658]MVO76483.1 hypothetical protein [Sphingomonas horti]